MNGQCAVTILARGCLVFTWGRKGFGYGLIVCQPIATERCGGYATGLVVSC